jgi:hypothetical protein
MRFTSYTDKELCFQFAYDTHSVDYSSRYRTGAVP